MLKDEYILNRFSKIQHKKWELFVITRIIHAISDFDIEFVCQQYVRRPHSGRAMTDLFFPQLRLHLEVDERQHLEEVHVAKDNLRSQDIMDATAHEIVRIPVFEVKIVDGKEMKIPRSLTEVSRDVDDFANRVLTAKNDLVASGQFEPWDINKKFDPTWHTKKGYVDVAENVVFSRVADALRCFGFTGKGYQRGAWRIKGDGRGVWFPQLVKHAAWDNSISADGQTIIEKRVDGRPIGKEKSEYPEPYTTRVVFAKFKDDLNNVMYRFVGEFAIVQRESTATMGVFKRIATRVATISDVYDPNKKFGGPVNAAFSVAVTDMVRTGELNVKR